MSFRVLVRVCESGSRRDAKALSAALYSRPWAAAARPALRRSRRLLIAAAPRRSSRRRHPSPSTDPRCSAGVAARTSRTTGGRHRLNASISGDTTSGGLARLPALLRQHRPSLVVIELGGNDALRGLPIESTRSNLAEMTRLARAAGARVLLLGMQLPPNYGRSYGERFSALYAEVARAEGAALVPFMLKGVADIEKSEAMFQPDRITAREPQPIILANVWPVLQPLLKSDLPRALARPAALHLVLAPFLAALLPLLATLLALRPRLLGRALLRRLLGGALRRRSARRCGSTGRIGSAGRATSAGLGCGAIGRCGSIAACAAAASRHAAARCGRGGSTRGSPRSPERASLSRKPSLRRSSPREPSPRWPVFAVHRRADRRHAHRRRERTRCAAEFRSRFAFRADRAAERPAAMRRLSRTLHRARRTTGAAVAATRAASALGSRRAARRGGAAGMVVVPALSVRSRPAFEAAVAAIAPSSGPVPSPSRRSPRRSSPSRSRPARSSPRCGAAIIIAIATCPAVVAVAIAAGAEVGALDRPAVATSKPGRRRAAWAPPPTPRFSANGGRIGRDSTLRVAAAARRPARRRTPAPAANRRRRHAAARRRGSDARARGCRTRSPARRSLHAGTSGS